MPPAKNVRRRPTVTDRPDLGDVAVEHAAADAAAAARDTTTPASDPVDPVDPDQEN